MQLTNCHVHSNIAQNCPMAVILLNTKCLRGRPITFYFRGMNSVFLPKIRNHVINAPKTGMVSVYCICDLIQVAIKLSGGRT